VTLLITSFAISSMMQNAFLMTVSPRAKGATPGWTNELVSFGPFEVPIIRLITIAVAAVCLVALLFFLRRSTMGLAMRGASEDFDAVRLMGSRPTGSSRWRSHLRGAGGVSALLVVAQTGSSNRRWGWPSCSTRSSPRSLEDSGASSGQW